MIYHRTHMSTSRQELNKSIILGTGYLRRLRNIFYEWKLWKLYRYENILTVVVVYSCILRSIFKRAQTSLHYAQNAEILWFIGYYPWVTFHEKLNLKSGPMKSYRTFVSNYNVMEGMLCPHPHRSILRNGNWAVSVTIWCEWNVWRIEC